MVRGDVHAITLPRRGGHVQHGRRFAGIVQADDLLALSTILVCPTSSSTPPASFHPEIVVNEEPTRVARPSLSLPAATIGPRALDQRGGFSQTAFLTREWTHEDSNQSFPPPGSWLRRQDMEQILRRVRKQSQEVQ